MSAGSAVRDLPANTHWLRGNAHQTDARNDILDCFGRSGPKLATNRFQSPNSGTLLEAVRWLITVALGAIFTLTTEPAEHPATIPALRCPACSRCRRFSTRVSPMAEVNRFPTCFRRPSAGGGPVAVCADVEIPSDCSRPRADNSAHPTSSHPLRRGHELRSRRFDSRHAAARAFSLLSRHEPRPLVDGPRGRRRAS